MATDDLDPLLFEQLGEGSPFEVVLRGHLWVEAQLIAILEEGFPFPERIDLGRFTYPQKVSLVAALGFIQPADVNSYMKLNSLRNRLAHRAGEEPTSTWAEDLTNTFGPHLQYLTQPFVSDFRWQWDEWQSRLKLGIVALCVALDAERTRYVAHRHQLEEVNRRLRQAAEKVKLTAEEAPEPGEAEIL